MCAISELSPLAIEKYRKFLPEKVIQSNGMKHFLGILLNIFIGPLNQKLGALVVQVELIFITQPACVTDAHHCHSYISEQEFTRTQVRKGRLEEKKQTRQPRITFTTSSDADTNHCLSTMKFIAQGSVFIHANRTCAY